MVIKRLFDSFVDLDRAITSAKSTLAVRPDVPQQVLDRLSSYDEILLKQKRLAAQMCNHARVGNWAEVTRHIKIINALSSMIRDDAKEIVSGMRPRMTTAERELMLS